MQETWVPSLGQEDPLEKGMAATQRATVLRNKGLESGPNHGHGCATSWFMSPWASQVALVIKNLPVNAKSLGQESPLDEEHGNLL